MPIYFLFRLLSIGIVLGAASLSLGSLTWLSLIYSLGLAHYLISLIYAKRRVLEFAQQPDMLLPIFSLAVVGTTLYVSRFPLVLYFALHHALNEAYLLNRGRTTAADAGLQAVRGSAALVHVFVYFLLLRHDLLANALSGNPLSLLVRLYPGGANAAQTRLLVIGLIVSILFFFFYLSRLSSSPSRPALLEQCGFELLGLVMVLVSFIVTVRVTFLHIVLYHFVVWTLIPLPALYEHSARRVLAYLGLMTVCATGFLAISPARPFSASLTPFTLAPALFYQQFTLWSYIHITTSLALSDAHPPWIVGLFRWRRRVEETPLPA